MMKNHAYLKLLLFAASLIGSACWCLTGDLDGVSVGSIPTVTPKSDTPTPEPSSTPTTTPTILPIEPTAVAVIEPTEEGRCDWFEKLGIKLFILDIKSDDKWITLYLEMPGGVPGIEILSDDPTVVWEYTGKLGDLESSDCSFQGYAERLYCIFPLPVEYHDSAHPFELFLNGCKDPIFDHARVSILVEPTEFDDIPPDICGPRPSSDTCNQEYADWCACNGGTYSCTVITGTVVNEVPVCVLP